MNTKKRKFDIAKFVDEMNELVKNNISTNDLKNYIISYLQLEILRGNIILPEEEAEETEKN